MKTIFAALALVVAAGCGSVTHGTTQKISVSSTPPGASARATCNDGSAAEAMTPGVLLMRRDAQGCSITISKAGFESETVPLTRAKSGSMFGNVPASVLSSVGGIVAGVLICNRNQSITGTCAAVGGLAGLILPGYIDARTGAMYAQRPSRVDVTLRPKAP